MSLSKLRKGELEVATRSESISLNMSKFWIQMSYGQESETEMTLASLKGQWFLNSPHSALKICAYLNTLFLQHSLKICYIEIICKEEWVKFIAAANSVWNL